MIAAVVAMDEARVIGKDGALPWHLPEDLAHFKRLTMGSVIIMGRKTWDSLPERFKPLPGRTNVVVSRSPQALTLPQGVLVADSPEGAIAAAKQVAPRGSTIWIIGGAELYRRTLPICDEVHLTRVVGVHEGDATFPAFEEGFLVVNQEQGERCTFLTYRRK